VIPWTWAEAGAADPRASSAAAATRSRSFGMRVSFPAGPGIGPVHVINGAQHPEVQSEVRCKA
jgi:hypothetical protein